MLLINSPWDKDWLHITALHSDARHMENQQPRELVWEAVQGFN